MNDSPFISIAFGDMIANDTYFRSNHLMETMTFSSMSVFMTL